MASNREVEIKFKIENIKILAARLKAEGFRLVTRRTHEMNTLYDQPGQSLRQRGDWKYPGNSTSRLLTVNYSFNGSGRQRARPHKCSFRVKLNSIFPGTLFPVQAYNLAVQFPSLRG